MEHTAQNFDGKKGRGRLASLSTPPGSVLGDESLTIVKLYLTLTPYTKLDNIVDSMVPVIILIYLKVCQYDAKK